MVATRFVELELDCWLLLWFDEAPINNGLREDVEGELSANLIDFAMLSKSVVKNSEASSCVPTLNTLDIFFILKHNVLGLAQPLTELNMSLMMRSTSHNEQKPFICLNLHVGEWGLDKSH
jgi:hypothetical protein